MITKPQAVVISSSFPPFNESSTIQLVERLRGLEQLGFEIVGIRPRNLDGSETSLHARLPRGLKVVETNPTIYDRGVRTFCRLPGGRRWAWIWANVASRVFVPDSRMGWDNAAVRTCEREIAEGRLLPKLIVSSSGSYTAHVAAAQLARHHRVPWIADLGDPWSICEDGSGPIRRLWNQRLELGSIPNASGAVFTTQSTLDAYRIFLGPRMPRAIALPCYGYNVEDCDSQRYNSRSSEPKRICLAHIGAAHKGNRDLRPLLSALATHIESTGGQVRFGFTVVGPHSRAFEEFASSKRLTEITFSDRVSYGDSMRLIRSADMLVIVGNKSRMQIPGKVYPYLGSLKPILYIGQLDENDPTRDLLAVFPGVVIARNSSDALLPALNRIDRSYFSLRSAAQSRFSLAAFMDLESRVVNRRFAEFVKETITCAGTACGRLE